MAFSDIKVYGTLINGCSGVISGSAPILIPRKRDSPLNTLVSTTLSWPNKVE